MAGDVGGAAALWSPAYLVESRSLDITYPDAVLPWDMASPLAMHLAALRAGDADHIEEAFRVHFEESAAALADVWPHHTGDSDAADRARSGGLPAVAN